METKLLMVINISTKIGVTLKNNTVKSELRDPNKKDIFPVGLRSNIL